MSPKQAPTRDSINRRDPDYLSRLDPQDVSTQCVPYTIMQPSLECIIPHYLADPVGVIEYPATNQEVYDAVSEAERKVGDAFIGIHETPDENVDGILSGGFVKDELGSRTVSADAFRSDAVYTWHHVWALNTQYEDRSGIIVSAPRNSVLVSEMSAAVTKSREVYEAKYVMDYDQYIRCLRDHGPVAMEAFERDIIQDLSDYRPTP